MRFSANTYCDLIVNATRETIPSVEYDEILDILVDCYKQKGIVFTMGCGGSASTASHFTADLAKTVGGFKSICLSDNVSLVSALTNDLGWPRSFDYQLETWITDKDVLVGFSVHGGSKDWSQNLVRAMQMAKQRGAKVIGFTSSQGGEMEKMSDVCLCVPTRNDLYDTPVSEGMHVVLAHGLAFDLKERIK